MPAFLTLPVLSRENSGIFLDAEGRWFHNGEPFAHAGLVELCNRHIAYDEQGRPVIRVGNEWVCVEVADTLFRVLRVELEPESGEVRQAHAILTNGDRVGIDPGMLELNPRTQVLYFRFDGEHLARFSRGAQQKFLDRALAEQDGRLGVRMNGQMVFPPGFDAS
ncbi:MAG: hypothetical protein GMKNLPBB_01167 [Myxococcota bacterium]|nr:hypothetical protein [Myxococcota bacterium]